MDKKAENLESNSQTIVCHYDMEIWSSFIYHISFLSLKWHLRSFPIKSNIF